MDTRISNETRQKNFLKSEIILGIWSLLHQLTNHLLQTESSMAYVVLRSALNFKLLNPDFVTRVRVVPVS